MAKKLIIPLALIFLLLIMPLASASIFNDFFKWVGITGKAITNNQDSKAMFCAGSCGGNYPNNGGSIWIDTGTSQYPKNQAAAAGCTGNFEWRNNNWLALCSREGNIKLCTSCGPGQYSGGKIWIPQGTSTYPKNQIYGDGCSGTPSWRNVNWISLCTDDSVYFCDSTGGNYPVFAGSIWIEPGTSQWPKNNVWGNSCAMGFKWTGDYWLDLSTKKYVAPPVIITPTAVKASCKDNDVTAEFPDGKNPYAKAKVEYYDADGNSVTDSDICVDASKVMEYYCEGTTPKRTNITCPDGCKDGVCVKAIPKTVQQWNVGETFSVERVSFPIHFTEGDSVKLNEYMVIKGRILKLKVIGLGIISAADKTVFRDVSTEEEFEFITGSVNHSIMSIDSKVYYVKVFNPGTNDAYVVLTYGVGATYGNVGTERTTIEIVDSSNYKIHLIEGENISLNELVPTYSSRILKLVNIGGTSAADVTKFSDINTGDQFTFETKIKYQDAYGRTLYGKYSVIDGEGYYASVPVYGSNVVLTYGVGATYGNVGDLTSYFIVKKSQEAITPSSTPEANQSQNVTCTDSDGGENYNVKGTAIGTVNRGSDGQIYDHNNKINLTDSCWTGISEVVTDGPQILEYYCENGIIESIIETCTYGCSDGACIEEESPINIPDTSLCADSDSGINYDIKGTISGTDAFGTSLDVSEACESDEMLDECYCTEESYECVQYTCPNGCSDGACIGGEGSAAQETQACVPEWNCAIEPAECPATGIQKRTCEDVKCGMETTQQDISCTTGQCAGCLYDEKCVPFGYRATLGGIPSYCSIEGTFDIQKEVDVGCANNHECRSNICVSDKCISANLFQQFLEWFKALFG